MAHRDELLALQARLEAQQKELAEARSEIELLRAAHAHKTHELMEAQRSLDDARGPLEHDSPFGQEDDLGGGFLDAATGGDGGKSRGPRTGGRLLGDGPPPGHRARWSGRDDGPPRPLAFTAALVTCMLFGSSMMMMVGGPCRARREARMAAAVPASVVAHRMYAGQVLASNDPTVAEVGDSCHVSLEPVTPVGGFDCRVEVHCGGRALYGATSNTGYVRCGQRLVVRDAHVTSADGDPAMRLDLRRQRVTVEEAVGLGVQRVEILLDAPTRSQF